MAISHPTLKRIALFVLCLALTSSAAAGVAAQTSPIPTLKIKLVAQPVWHEPGDDLAIRLRVTNVGSRDVRGFGIRVGVYPRAGSRSALHEDLDATVGSEPEARTIPYDQEVLAPGDSTTVMTKGRVDDLATVGAAGPDGGVYPLTLSVVNLETAEVLDTLTTMLIYYPEAPVARLGLVTVVPLNDVPWEGPGGTFTVPSTGEVPLEDATLRQGWLSGLVQALDEAVTQKKPPPQEEPRGRGRKGRQGRQQTKQKTPRALHIGLAPSPRLLQELVDLAAGYEREDGSEVSRDSPRARAAAAQLETLRHALGQEGVQSLLLPYSFPDLPTLTPPEILQQLSEGQSVFGEVLNRKVSSDWLFPPGGRLDVDTLEALQLTGGYARHIGLVASGSAVPMEDPELSGCPDEPYTFACPVSLKTSQGTSTGYLSDPGLEDRLTPLAQPHGNDRLALQQFFAETSMIREEQPGRVGRVIQATIPSTWHPNPRLSRVLFRGLQNAPWLKSLTPQEGLQGPIEPFPRALVQTETPVSTDLPTGFYETTLPAAEQVVLSYKQVAASDTERLRRLEQNLLVAESRSLWRDSATAVSFVTSSQQEAKDVMSKIKIIGVDDVTLTSSGGKFQLVLANGTGTPVTVSVELDAPQLEVDPDLLDKLSATYAPGNHPLTISATARSSGSFPLAVRIQSKDGYPIVEKDIQIRSTAFNRIALSITVGALLFLILFYLLRALRRSRSKDDPGADAA